LQFSLAGLVPKRIVAETTPASVFAESVW